GWFAAGTGARPDFSTVHRKHPDAIRITWMQHNWEADVTDVFGHVHADSFPLLLRTIQPIDAAMVLLIEAFRMTRMYCHSMWIVPVLRIRVRQKIRRDALVQWMPGIAGVPAFEHTPDGNTEIEMTRVAGINAHGMHLRAVRTGNDGMLDLLVEHIVEAGHFSPGGAAVDGPEKSWR